MFKKFIEQYINGLTNQDILEFSKKNGIDLNEDELQIISYHIKNDWETIIYGNPEQILNNIKNKVKPLTYEKIENLYSYFHEKYKNYL